MATETKKPKVFDCVEMKHKAQAEIMAEWEQRKGEFSSYEEFLEAGVKESPWGRQMLERLHRKTANAG